MTKIAYEDWNPKADTLAVVDEADRICANYQARGLDLTLRQLYYRFVAQALIPNTEKSYKRLGSIVDSARLAGMLDWDHIVDRTRNLKGLANFDSPADVINAARWSYRNDKWRTQPTRVEVWVEKEALAGVIARTANQYDCDWFACRGYVSQSEMWNAAQRLGRYISGGQNVLVLHLGDHDPSGIDMTRDIETRLTKFMHGDGRIHAEPFVNEGLFDVKRIALTMDQVRQYNPPPNPAKVTDSRFEAYQVEYGDESWELDALDPDVLAALIEDEILAVRDVDLWRVAVNEENVGKALLKSTAEHWTRVAEHVAGQWPLKVELLVNDESDES